MKRNNYQIGDLLIKLSNQQPHVITAIRETAKREYGSVGSIRKPSFTALDILLTAEL